MSRTVMFINVLFPGMWPLKVGSEKFDDMLVLSFVGQTRFVSLEITFFQSSKTSRFVERLHSMIIDCICNTFTLHELKFNLEKLMFTCSY